MEAKRFGKVYNIRCVCCYGGGSKWEQTKALEGKKNQSMCDLKDSLKQCTAKIISKTLRRGD